MLRSIKTALFRTFIYSRLRHFYYPDIMEEYKAFGPIEGYLNLTMRRANTVQLLECQLDLLTNIGCWRSNRWSGRSTYLGISRAQT